MKGLTLKQLEILEFIQQFIARHRYSPSYREIMLQFDFASPGSVYKHIRTLERKGALSLKKGSHRSLMPIQNLLSSHKEHSEVLIPLIGNLSVGYPLEVFIDPQSMQVPSSMVHTPDNTYIIQVQGNSLQDEWIIDGDLLLIEARTDINPGEVILGVINQNHTILKRYFPEGQNIRLESRNKESNPLTVRNEHISIQGVLVGLLRVYTQD